MKLTCPAASNVEAAAADASQHRSAIDSKEQLLRIVRYLYFLSLFISLAFDGFYVSHLAYVHG